MSLIYVRAKAGRVAYSAPKGGELIPADRYIPVRMTPYIDRLLNVHGDIELEPRRTTKSKAAAPETAATAEKKES